MPTRILVVDDNNEVVQVVTLLLESKGYQVVAAYSGEEALTLMEQQRPDLILCDIMMPGLDGYQVFQRVRADRRWRMIPFVFLTALTDPKTRVSSFELGVEGFITKPFRHQELLALVGGLLHRARELQSYTETELDSFKAQLLFMITHELNTPLSVIRMLTDSMRSSVDRLSRSQMSEYVELLARSTGELSYVVESMLLALQIDSGRAQTLYDSWAAPQQLRTLLDVVLTNATAKAAERHVTIKQIGFDQALWVEGHEQQLLQVFNRILDNAIRFSPKGGQVTVQLERVGDRARVTFTDQGPGLTPNEIEAAFDRLRQINRAQQEQQGIGLSLNLVRSLVAIHGGEISVKSEPGKGSSFTVSLSLIEAPV
jgi:signal transduction histidine kinase